MPFFDKETIKVHAIGCGGLLFGIIAFIIIIGLFLGAFYGLWAWYSYNKLVNLRENITASWKDIDIILNRRDELIPKLLNVAQKYAKYEKDTMESIIKARAISINIDKADNLKSIAQSLKTQSTLSKALSRLIMLNESYPKLNADQQYIEIVNELRDINNKLENLRNLYNNNVKKYNKIIKSIPIKWVAKKWNFIEAVYWETISEDIKNSNEVKTE